MKPKVVASASNPTFKDLRKLLSARGIQEQGLALFAGDKHLPEVFMNHLSQVDSWITPVGGEAPPAEVAWVQLAKELYEELDQFGTNKPLVTVKVPDIPEYCPESAWPRGCSLFLALQNPDNVGAVVRSAAAFGVARIVLLKECAHPFHPKAMRAAGTALLSLKFEKGPAIAELDVKTKPIFALDMSGTPLRRVVFPERFGLLPGVEGPGIPGGVPKSSRISIPMSPGVESLNAGVATAIALYEWKSRGT